MKNKQAKIAAYILLFILIGCTGFYIGMRFYDNAYQAGFRDGVQFVLDELTKLIQR